MPRLIRRACATAFLLTLLSALPASAAPPTAAIKAVYRAADCSGTPCSGSKGKLAPSTLIDGGIEVQWRAASDLGLARVRLEGRVAGGRWNCVQVWTPTGSRETEGRYVWDTHTWPPVSQEWRCDDDADPVHKHGEHAENGAYELRVMARDLTGEEKLSSLFAFKINNEPATPIWGGDLVVQGGSKPGVLLRWYTNLEPDLAGYEIARIAPDKRSSTIWINPKKAVASGCEKALFPMVKCTDSSFAGRPSGTYRYRVTAYRRSIASGAACGSFERCIASSANVYRSVRVRVEAGVIAPVDPVANDAALTAVPESTPTAIQRATAARAGASTRRNAADPFGVGASGPEDRASRAFPMWFAVVALLGALGALVLHFDRWQRLHRDRS